jgi:hypothetical protein
MTRVAQRVQMTAAAFLAAGAFAFGLAGGSGATARAPQDKLTVPGTKAADQVCGYLGKGPTKETGGEIVTSIAGCQFCHNGPDVGQAGTFVKNWKSHEFVLLNEAVTWTGKDIHSRALETLGGPLGQQMQRSLARGDKNYTVARDVRCLACHSADKSPTKPLPEKKYEDFATASEGINCTVCHGMHQRWQNDHYLTPDQKEQPMPWRSKPPAYKWERGMADLRNPVVKAMLCVSCHVGNAAEGKVVTHEMYAAGHPPLPPFELASYMEGEPKHWAYPTDERLKFFASVPEKARWQLFHFHAAKEESYLSRHYVVGAVAALRAEAELLFADAEAAAKGDGLDFARFDCYACHHDLKYPSDRQNRGYDGPPGRPTLRAAAGIPAGVVAKHAETIKAGGLDSKAAGFDAKWAGLKAAAVARPFGHPEKVRESAKAMMDWCDGFLTVQCECPTPLYPASEAKRLRAMITEAAVGPAAADPEAAMCLGWGYLTLANEAKVALPDEKVKALTAVIPENVRSEPYTVKIPDPMTKMEISQPKTAQFKPRMEKLNAFQADPFRAALKALGQ